MTNTYIFGLSKHSHDECNQNIIDIKKDTCFYIEKQEDYLKKELKNCIMKAGFDVEK